jgi:hypothetical protein
MPRRNYSGGRERLKHDETYVVYLKRRLSQERQQRWNDPTTTTPKPRNVPRRS